MFKKVLIVLALSVSSLMAYSYTCFPPMTEKGSFVINPAFFMDDNNSGGMETFLYYGLTDKSDFCSSILTVNGSSNFSVMYRHILGSLLNAGIRMNSSWATPQINYNWENKVLILDSRPSDATAISLRSGKDIWIKKEILEEFAVKEC